VVSLVRGVAGDRTIQRVMNTFLEQS